MELATLFLLVVISLLIYLLYFYRHKQFDYFKQRNIPTPPFHFLFGHLLPIWSEGSIGRQLQIWTRIYGKTYGIFSGASPVYVTSEIDFLEEVFIKQFSKFDRRKIDLYEHSWSGSKRGVFNTNGNQWRRQKSIMSSTLNAAVKQLNPLLNKHIKDMLLSLRSLTSNGDVAINLHPILKETFWKFICKFLRDIAMDCCSFFD